MLVVDASQGVEAQTLANVYLAVNNNLTIVPVINKIDLPAADPENVRRQIEEVIGIDASDAILASAKDGKGIHEILEAVVAKMPPPVGDPAAPLQALLLDSWYDAYRGVVILVRVVDGVLRPKQKMRFMAARRDYEIQTIGAFAPFAREVPELGAGRGRLLHRRHQGGRRRARRRHHHRGRPPVRDRAARLPAGQADGVRRDLPDGLGALRRTCATRSTSCASTTRRSRTSRRPRRRSASAFAAASSACCTWRSSRSGSSASTTST